MLLLVSIFYLFSKAFCLLMFTSYAHIVHVVLKGKNKWHVTRFSSNITSDAKVRRYLQAAKYNESFIAAKPGQNTK